MARRRRRSRSVTQQLVTEQIVRRMPLPMRFALENRTHGALTFVIVAALIGSGIISIQWQSGQANVQLHPDRAREVGSQVVDHVRDLRESRDYEQWTQQAELPAADSTEPLGELILR